MDWNQLFGTLGDVVGSAFDYLGNRDTNRAQVTTAVLGNQRFAWLSNPLVIGGAVLIAYFIFRKKRR